MIRYRYIGTKPHVRTRTVAVHQLRGTTMEVIATGEPQTLQPGEVVDDLTAGELEGMEDRFERLDDEEGATT